MADTLVAPSGAYWRPTLVERARMAIYEFRHRFFPPVSNLEHFARQELALIGADGEDDKMQAAINRHILKMVRTFSREGHSGFSASYAIDILEKLLRYEPLSPLAGGDDEWNDISEMSDEPCWQNRRCSHVFKGADGRAYDIQGKVFVEPSGYSYTGSGSRVFIEFPYRPTIEYVQVEDQDLSIEMSQAAILDRRIARLKRSKKKHSHLVARRAALDATA